MEERAPLRDWSLAILGALNWTARWFRPEGKKTARTVAE